MSKILRQSLWLFLAQGISRAIGFFYTIFLARSLGVENFGLYSVALAYFSLVSIISEFGFNRFLIRELSLGRLKLPQLIFNIATLRLLIAALLFVIFGFGLYILDPDKLRVNLALLMILAVFPNSLAQTFDSIFVAFQKLQFSAFAIILSNIFIVFLGVILVVAKFGPTGAAIALILGQFVYVALLFLLLKSNNLELSLKASINTLREIVLGSLPYGILGVLGLLYFKIDTLMLSYLKGNFDTGIYSAAYKFLEALVFVPSSVASALFPVLARLHESRTSEIRPIYIKSTLSLGVLGIIIAVLYIFVLPIIIRQFLPAYLSSIQVIQILAVAIPFMFLHVPGAQVLLSTNRFLKQIIILSIFTLSFNVILNLIFIPKYGYLGASWVTVASEVVSMVAFFGLLQIKVLRLK
mgnify:FL=1